MTLRIVVRPDAGTEIDAARAWYERCRPGLGAEFVEAIDATIVHLARRPEMYPRVHGDVHRAVVRRFPYAVYYRCVAEEILVLAVVHGHRHPRVWRRRVRRR